MMHPLLTSLKELSEAAGQALPLLEKYADCSIKNSPRLVAGRVNVVLHR